MQNAPPSKWAARWPLLAPVLAVGVVVWVMIPAPVPEAGVLVGRWSRDGDPYVLEVRSARADGTADVAYFNPKPIHVARATVSRDGALGLFVELRDEGYPGSTYTLVYDPAGGGLRGEYFQAQQGSRIPVSFSRATPPP